MRSTSRPSRDGGRIPSAPSLWRLPVRLGVVAVWILTPLLIVNLPAASSGPLDVDGQWAPKTAMPLVAVHTMALHTGKYLVLDAWELPSATARVWDPVPNTFTTVPVGAGIFCSGHAQLPDGKMLAAGGHAGGEVGIKDTWVFDPVATSWTKKANMQFARWYPSLTTLGDGRMVAISGQDNPGHWIDTPEVYNPVTDTWTALTGVSTASIRELGYPLSYLMPDGRIFVHGSSNGATGILDVDARTWSPGPSTTVINGSTALYGPGKVIVVGEEANSAAAAVIDLTAANPAWRNVSSPSAQRYEQNVVVLADGKVMNVGGSASSQLNTTPVLSNEIWDPATELWTTVASGADARMYHSTALLQADGTLLSAGGGRLGNYPDVLSAQVYSPPYLFRGPRPTITGAPATAGYGAPFSVQTPNGASVVKVFLNKLGSVTHTLNMDPQFLSLPFNPVAGGLTVTGPTTANLAPPGYYNLWIVDSNGVPSLSRQVKVGGTDVTPPTAPGSLTATGGAGKGSLSWTAAGDDVAVSGYNVHRSTTTGFTPSLANRVAQPTGTTFDDNGLAASTYYYKVTAQDGAGNVGPSSNQAQAAVTPDVTAPTAAVTSPATGAVVSNTITVGASATDAVGVVGVQFKLDGANVGPEDTAPPFSASWNTRTSVNGSHTLTAVARDKAGNVGTSPPLTVTVTNTGPAGLVGAWSFDEGTGSTTADLSGSGNTGTLANATWTAGGRYGGALSFNGTNASVMVPDADSLDLTTGMTLEAWVRPAATMGTAWRTAVMKEQPSQLVYGLYANGDASRPRAQMWIGGTEQGVAGTSTVAASTWTHLAATYDGAALRFYANGVQVANTDVTGDITTSSAALRIGGNAAWGEFFNGLIDEVRIYNRAITSTELQNDMSTGIGVLKTDTSPPTAPSSLTASIGSGTAGLIWTAATDNVGLAGYDVHRSTAAGFTPAIANRIAQPSGTSLSDPGLAPGTYFYKVVARDAAGNLSPASKDASATLPSDATVPVAAVTAPAAGATVVGTQAVTATATDAVDTSTAPVQVADNRFQAVSTTITAGSTVTWTKTGSNSHTVRADDGSFDSGGLAAGATFSRIFTSPGTYRFYCPIHGAPGGTGMSGTIVVQPAPAGTVAGVQFRVDGANLGAEDTTAPYAVSWNTAGVANGPHTLTAVARDVAGNTGTAANVGVTVANAAPTGLVGAWSFDEGAGTVAVDASGRTNNGTLSNATWSAAGRFGKAVSFNGTNATVVVPDASSLDLTTGMTVEAWVKPTAAMGTAWRTAVMKESATDQSYSLYANSSASRPAGEVFLTTSKSVAGTATVATNAWTHLATTYDGTTLRLYVNGVLVRSGSFPGAIKVSSSPLRFGGNAVWGEYFNGLLDDVRIYNRALTAAEVSSDMSSPVAPPAPDATAPTVSVAAPAPGATVSGSVAVTANASDAVGVVGVQFKLDGANLGAEDTTAPYSVSWNTTAASNGSHTLTAVARDAAANSATSAPVSLTVANTGPAGLVGAWSFDEGSGTVVGDVSGMANHGTLSNAIWNGPGKFGSALSFNGTNASVLVPDANTLDLTTGMTIEAWVNPTAAMGDTWRNAVMKERGADQSYSLYANGSTGRPRGEVFLASGGKVVAGTAAVAANAWTHLATTYDGATLRLFVNGIQVSSAAASGNITTSTGPLRFGGNGPWGEWFSGRIDEVRIYNRALTAAQIQTDMATAVSQ